MTPERFLRTAIVPALELLPSSMDSWAAQAMIIAACLQESRLRHRRQIGGPARGYAQFEAGGGVRGVLRHPASRAHVLVVLRALDYGEDVDVTDCYIAIEHNDILAAAFARLLLWTLPGTLPVREDAEGAYQYYLESWRPGKPHPETWGAFYAQAWAVVAGGGLDPAHTAL